MRLSSRRFERISASKLEIIMIHSESFLWSLNSTVFKSNLKIAPKK